MTPKRLDPDQVVAKAAAFGVAQEDAQNQRLAELLARMQVYPGCACVELVLARAKVQLKPQAATKAQRELSFDLGGCGRQT